MTDPLRVDFRRGRFFLYDNVAITEIPEPATLALLGHCHGGVADHATSGGLLVQMLD